MALLLRFVWLVIIAVLGGIAYGLSANIMVMAGLLSSDSVSTSFGVDMTQKAVLVWLVCVALGLGACFLQTKWRYVLLFSPLFGPSAFALLYTLLNQTPAP